MTEEHICMGCMEERGGETQCPHCGWKEGTPPSSPLYLTPRTVLGDQFLVGRVLGHGGFGLMLITTLGKGLQFSDAYHYSVFGIYGSRGFFFTQQSEIS